MSDTTPAETAPDTAPAAPATLPADGSVAAKEAPPPTARNVPTLFMAEQSHVQIVLTAVLPGDNGKGITLTAPLPAFTPQAFLLAFASLQAKRAEIEKG